MASSPGALPDVVRYFFGQALPAATGKTFAELTSPLVHIGSYTAYTGAPVTSALGQPITPRYCLHLSAPLAVADGSPNPDGVAVPADGPLAHLLWVRHVADPAVDDADEIQRVMADVDTFADLFSAASGSGAAGSPSPQAAGAGGPPSGAPAAGGAGPVPTAGTAGAPAGAGSTGSPADATGTAGSPASTATTATSSAAGRASDWAQAVVASRAALSVDLDALTAVPAALAPLIDTVDGLKEVLRRFFTYDASGHRYSRWSGAGRDGSNGAHLTADYKRENIREVVLDRNSLYLYAVVPETLLGAPADLAGGGFREFVVRFAPTGDPQRPFSMSTVHTARWRRNAAPYEDFVFFYAADGAGVPVSAAAENTIAPRLLNFMGDIVVSADRSVDFLANAHQAGPTDQGTLVHLLATVEGDVQFPPGVIAHGDGPVRILLAPADQIAAIAELPAVKRLDVVPPFSPSNDLARAMVNDAGLEAKIAAAKRDGQGVVIGIIDSGIDGSHPAFAGRIHAFWDQGNPMLVAGVSPAGNNPANAAYNAFNFGVELTGANTANARDVDGHGTHVAGIAAGAEVRDAAGAIQMAAGMAPAARIVAVRAIGAGRGDPFLAAAYIFQKASELGLPAVINMSFGQHYHAHDGTDDSSRQFFNVVRSGGAYRPGRILVAAAGNDRSRNTHLKRIVPANSGRFILATVQLALGVIWEPVIIWIKDPTGTKPAAFPVDLYVYRRTMNRNTNLDVSRAVRLGGSAVGPSPAGTFVNHRTVVEIGSEVSNVTNGDHHFDLTFKSTTATAANPMPMLADQWGIVMVNGSPQPLEVHLWLAKTPHTASQFMDAVNPDDHAYLVGSPAAGPSTISVASVTSRLSWTSVAGVRTDPAQPRLRELSDFSSPGPLRPSSIPIGTAYGVPDQINAIDTAAPGAWLQSALSAQWAALPVANPNAVQPEMQINPRAVVMSGTSMASPVVTGLVAELLANNPAMTTLDVMAALKRASTIPADSEFQPPPGTPGPKPLSVDWGYGLVDASQLLP